MADETATKPEVTVTGATVYAVTAVQAANMTREAVAGGGITGTDLDAAVPTHGAPPMAYVIGGWVLAANDAASAAAARLLGPVDWTHAADVVFPTEVLALFVGDVVQHMTTTTSAARSGAGATVAAPAQLDVARPGRGTGPDRAVQHHRELLQHHLEHGVQRVEARPERGLGLGERQARRRGPGRDRRGVRGLVRLRRGTGPSTSPGPRRETVLTQLTQPVLDILRLAIGAVATITTVVSYLKPWKAPITADPAANQFGITGGPARTGSATVAIDKQAEIANWPPQLVDCADDLRHHVADTLEIGTAGHVGGLRTRSARHRRPAVGPTVRRSIERRARRAPCSTRP